MTLLPARVHAGLEAIPQIHCGSRGTAEKRGGIVEADAAGRSAAGPAHRRAPLVATERGCAGGSAHHDASRRKVRQPAAGGGGVSIDVGMDQAGDEIGSGLIPAVGRRQVDLGPGPVQALLFWSGMCSKGGE